MSDILFPTKIVALAYNYKGMDEEPLIFIKPRTSLIATGFAIRVPEGADVWAEVELAIGIGLTACNVSVTEAAQYISGYAVANDVTMMNPILGRDWHLPPSKGLDTFCPLSQIINPSLYTDALGMRTWINDELCQEGNTRDRKLNDCEAISFISKFITLEAGDIVLTGTPGGVGKTRIVPGDIVSMKIDGVGALTNPVVGRKL